MTQRLLDKIPLALMLGLVIGIAVSVSIGYGKLYQSRNEIRTPEGGLIGADFLIFYLAGRLSEEDLSKVYDFQATDEAQSQFLTPLKIENPHLPFVYPPLTIIPFAMLSRFSYATAVQIFSVLSILSAVLGLLLCMNLLGIRWQVRMVLLLGAVSFPPFLMICVPCGQVSTFSLLIWCLIYLGFWKNNGIFEGFSLSLGYLKPPLFVLYAACILFTRQKAVLISATISALLLGTASLYYVSWEGINNFVIALQAHRYGATYPDGRIFTHTRGVGLIAILVSIFPGSMQIAWGIFLLILLILLLDLRKIVQSLMLTRIKGRSSNLAFAYAMSLSNFTSVQFLDYDLTILLLPMLIVAHYVLFDKSPPRPAQIVPFFFLYIASIIEPISLGGHTFNCLALASLLWCVWIRLLLADEKTVFYSTSDETL